MSNDEKFAGSHLGQLVFARVTQAPTKAPWLPVAHCAAALHIYQKAPAVDL